MKYTIKSKLSLMKIKRDLISNDLTTIKHDQELEINITTKEQLKCLIEVLSKRIAFLFTKDLFFKTFLTGNCNQSEVRDLFADFVSAPEILEYYELLTQIHVAEYFKRRKVLNIESFQLFNLRGFKEEILEEIETYRMCMGSIGEFSGILEEFPLFKEPQVPINPLEEIKLKIGDHEKVNRIDVYGETLELYTDKKEKVDMEYVLDRIGVTLQTHIDNVFEDKRFLLEKVAILSCVVASIGVEEVKIHGNVPIRMVNSITSSIGAVDPNTSIVFCRGCDLCHD